MIPAYRGQASLGIGLWFLLKIAAIVWAVAVGQDAPMGKTVFWILFVGGTLCLLWGGWAQAKGKGYPGALGLLGLVGLLGLIILAILPDRAPQNVPVANPASGLR